MRKVKFCAEAIHEKFAETLDGFPKLEDIHPFYADLINVVYDKDHYKIALGHMRTARNLVDNIAKDYVRMLKHGDSLYRCKMLKRSALGRMVKIIKKLGPSLSFLEEVRKHLARMPSIDPYTRTIIITGLPNVGKSSFMNHVTNANVDVQGYAFTTQSLFVGHTYFNTVKWQIIDSPGILDHPLDERNTIEMQTITALAHLKACILFFIDISEECSYPIEEQVSLFKNIKALFVNKPCIIGLTKTDVQSFNDLEPSKKALIEELAKENEIKVYELSNKNGEGVGLVKQEACNLLLDYRLNEKKETGPSQTLKREEDFLKGVYIAKPKTVREDRPPVIPKEIIHGIPLKLNRPTLKDVQDEMGGAGVFNFPLQEHFLLEDEDWKYDEVPEIMNGMNVADFYDKDIQAKLEELEREEEMLLYGKPLEELEEEDDPDLLEAQQQIKNKKAILKIERKLKLKKTAFSRNFDLEGVEDDLKSKGKDTQGIRQRFKDKSKPKPLSKLFKEATEDDEIEVNNKGGIHDEQEEQKHETDRNSRKLDRKIRSMSRGRSQGTKRELSESERNMERIKHKIQRKWRHDPSVGEADRKIPDMMPKHLFAGKR